MIHRLILIVCLIAVVSGQRHYNISIAPLVDAIEKADALYRDWYTILADLQAPPTPGAMKISGEKLVIERAVIAMWTDREPPREWSADMDPHMKQSLLEEIAEIFEEYRPDLTLRGSTHVWQTDCNHCSGKRVCTAMACGYKRRSILKVTRAPLGETVEFREAPPPLLYYYWYDEEMRAHWYCSESSWYSGEDDCEFQQDSPPAATSPGPVGASTQ